MTASASIHTWSPTALNWPYHEASRFIEAGGHRWHVQRIGAGPPLLLLHGTGASTHSWAPMLPFLTADFEVIAIDLPEHAFTQSLRKKPLTLPYAAQSVAALIKQLGVTPHCVIGHSAGAAIMIRMILSGYIAPDCAVSINGALKPFDGPAGFIFPLFAKALQFNPFTSHFFAWRAQNRARVEALIGQTGSRIPQAQADCYATLLKNPDHISGALSMMANWDLSALAREMRSLQTPIVFVAGEKDAAVPPSVSRDAARAAPNGVFRLLPGLGHLAHEEQPEETVAVIAETMRCVA